MALSSGVHQFLFIKNNTLCIVLAREKMSGECERCNEHCLDCMCDIRRCYLMSKYAYPHKTINGVKKRLHRHIMEEHIGRPLESYEHVYHINGDYLDNRIDNLVVIVKKVKKYYLSDSL